MANSKILYNQDAAGADIWMKVIDNGDATYSFSVSGTVTATDAANGTPGSAAPTTATQVGGTDGTNLRAIKTDTSGNLIVQGLSGGQPMPIAGLTANTVMSSTNPIGVYLYASPSGSTGWSIAQASTDTLTAASTTSIPVVTNWARLWNGTNGSRTYQISAATGTTGIGVTAVATAGAATAHITTATTTTVKSGAGIAHEILIGTPVASATITVYDSLTASGTILAVITLPSVITAFGPVAVMRDRAFATGLTIVTSGATDLSVSYR